MNEKQKYLARSALGLTSGKKKSYRNRFFARDGSEELREWQALQDTGMAVGAKAYKGMTLFFLTLKGARAAMEPGESLCAEDFPGEEVDNGSI